LHREVVEKKRLERELQMARASNATCCLKLLRSWTDSTSRCSRALLEVGGDTYDFLTMGPNTLLVVIADVEGKGRVERHGGCRTCKPRFTRW